MTAGYAYPVGDIYVPADWANHRNRNPPSQEPGTDYAAAYGTPVLAIADGVVSYVKTTTSGGTGRYVKVDLDDGRSDRNLHMSRCDVVAGTRVVRDQTVLGLSGASGYGSDYYYGSHLHETLLPTPSTALTSSIDFENYVGGEPAPEPTPTEDPMYVIEATEPALRKNPNGEFIIQKGWQLAYTPGQPLKVLSSLEADLIKNKQGERPVPYIYWNRSSMEALVKSNGLIETSDYVAGAPPSSRLRYSDSDYRYLVTASSTPPTSTTQSQLVIPAWIAAAAAIGIFVVLAVVNLVT